MDKEAAEHMLGRLQSVERLADMANWPHMEEVRRCTRPMEVQRNNCVESCYEINREDSEQEVA